MTQDEALKIIWECEFQEIIANQVGWLQAMAAARDKYNCEFDDLPGSLKEFLVDMENAAEDYLGV